MTLQRLLEQIRRAAVEHEALLDEFEERIRALERTISRRRSDQQ